MDWTKLENTSIATATQFDLGLNEIFAFQNSCADAHLAESPLLRASYDLVSDAFRLTNEILQTMTFEAQKQTAIRILTVDALSHTAVAMRLGLWGALPESVAVWRGALESSAQLRLVVKEQSYKTFNYELSGKLKRLSYGRAFEELGRLGEGLESLHGKLSEKAVHSTAKRLALSDYVWDGQEYDRLGFARKIEYPLYITHHSMLLTMLLSDALYSAHEQEDRVYPLTDRLSSLLSRFDELCARFKADVPGLRARGEKASTNQQ